MLCHELDFGDRDRWSSGLHRSLVIGEVSSGGLNTFEVTMDIKVHPYDRCALG